MKEKLRTRITVTSSANGSTDQLGKRLGMREREDVTQPDPESIELLYRLRGSNPTTSPPSPVNKLDRRHLGRLKRETTCWRKKGEKVVEPNHTTARKTGPLLSIDSKFFGPPSPFWIDI
jgi:hypothetical protein